MEDSEYFVQIFLFVATIICYILLAVFVFYGIYHCCIRACILRITRKGRDEDGDNEEVQNSEKRSYCRHVRLLYPFQRDEKKGMSAKRNFHVIHITLHIMMIVFNVMWYIIFNVESYKSLFVNFLPSLSMVIVYGHFSWFIYRINFYFE